MNVLFDIGMLGARRGNTVEQTGVFRAAEELARGLSESTKCSVRFCAEMSVASAADYLAGSDFGKDAKFAHSARQIRLSRLIQPASDYISATASDRRLSQRLLRRLMSLTSGPVHTAASHISSETFRWADIYHTPHAQLRPQLANRRDPRPLPFVTVYDLIALKFPQYYEPWFVAGMRKHLANICNHSVIAISQCTKTDILNHFKCDASRVFVVPLAAAQSFYPVKDSEAIQRTRDRYSIPPGPYVASLCTLEPRKNLDFIIRSFARLIRETNISDLNLVLMGNAGWQMHKIRNALEECSDVKERIVFTGHVQDRDLASLYSGAIVFVYMSLYEGFGLPPLEAMQCGVPVLTSNTSSLPEVVAYGGQMLDPTDADGFCQTVLRLVNNPEERRHWGKRALERASEFSWSRTIDHLVSAYQEGLVASK